LHHLNHTADNSNARGDQWNDEDFSVFSRDQQWNQATSTAEAGRWPRAPIRCHRRKTGPVKIHIHKKR
jgi:hypothetical protein